MAAPKPKPPAKKKPAVPAKPAAPGKMPPALLAKMAGKKAPKKPGGASPSKT